MAETGPITIAVAGAGATTDANLTELLNDFLGFGEEDDEGFFAPSDREVTLILPAGDGWSNKELHKVVDWSAKADLPYFVVADAAAVDKPKALVRKTLDDAQEVKEVSDVGAELLLALDELGDPEAEKYLVLLYGDDEDGPGEEIEELLESALEIGVSVKDITGGLDDIKFAEEDTPADAPDIEAEPAPTRSRVRPSRAAEEQTVEEQPLEQTPQQAALLAKAEGAAKKAEVLAKTNANLKAKQDAEDLPHDHPSSPEAGSILVQVEDLTAILEVVKYATAYFGAEDTTNAAVNLAPAVQYRPLTVALAEVQDTLGALVGQNTPSEATGSTETAEKESGGAEDRDAPAAPRKSRGRPRADGSPAQAKDPDEPTINVFEDEDGNLTKAGRGRPPKGQKRTKITEAQAREAGLLD